MGLMDHARELPGIQAYRKWKYGRRFVTAASHNLFWGSFDSFEDAREQAPTDLPVGYDNPAAAAMYDETVERVPPVHYPALFWLSTEWAGLRRILDFGGHRGVLFYASRRRLGPGPEWVVHDVPAVLEAGRRRVAELGVEGLRFEDEPSEFGELDMLIASGALQYVDLDPAAWLDWLGQRPRAVLLSATPFHTRRTVITLNNIGTAYCPYMVRHEAPFFQAWADLGYREVDRWHHPDKRCDVPFHVPGHEISYQGAYLVRDDD